MKSERLICNSVQPVNHNAQKKKNIYIGRRRRFLPLSLVFHFNFILDNKSVILVFMFS